MAKMKKLLFVIMMCVAVVANLALSSNRATFVFCIPAMITNDAKLIKYNMKLK